MRTRIGLPLLLLAVLLIAGPARAQETLEVAAPAGAVEFSFQQLETNKLLISAADAEGNPLRNLTIEDFIVKRAGKQAQILAAEPLETSKDVSLNIVMVVDNSASMRRRRAVEPIIRAMENLYAIIRPIDNITVIVFSDDETIPFGDYNLHVRMKQSNRIEELRAFVRESFDENLTNKTVVYEGMLAGLSVLYNLPEEANKFMVVFTDGEDINSAFRGPVVEKAAEGIANFEAYAIDYMPASETDP
ncbi:MAG: VWA domain-containing protein, partial [Desulfobacterales bacterium]